MPIESPALDFALMLEWMVNGGPSERIISRRRRRGFSETKDNAALDNNSMRGGWRSGPQRKQQGCIS